MCAAVRTGLSGYALCEGARHKSLHPAHPIYRDCVLWPYLYDILGKAKLATENRAAVARGRGGGGDKLKRAQGTFWGRESVSYHGFGRSCMAV